MTAEYSFRREENQSIFRQNFMRFLPAKRTYGKPAPRLRPRKRDVARGAAEQRVVRKAGLPAERTLSNSTSYNECGRRDLSVPIPTIKGSGRDPVPLRGTETRMPCGRRRNNLRLRNLRTLCAEGGLARRTHAFKLDIVQRVRKAGLVRPDPHDQGIGTRSRPASRDGNPHALWAPKK